MHFHIESTNDSQTHEEQSWVRKLNCLILGCLQPPLFSFLKLRQVELYEIDNPVSSQSNHAVIAKFGENTILSTYKPEMSGFVAVQFDLRLLGIALVEFM